MAAAYDPNHKTILFEAVETAGGRAVYEIDTISRTVKSITPLTGLSGKLPPNQIFGGIFEDAKRQVAIAAGVDDFGMLDTSSSPPVWNATSITTTEVTDSIAYNPQSGMLFISGDNSNEIVDTTQSPMTPLSFTVQNVTNSGVGFDPTTNIMLLSPEGAATSSVWSFNLETLDSSISPATAAAIQVAGMDVAGSVGQGPGGQVAINCRTHQAVSADEFGENLQIVQLPRKAQAGDLNNNGQPGADTEANAASVFTVASALVPDATGNGQPASLIMLGNPNTPTIDIVHDRLYVLALDQSAGIEYLLRLDLSNPVFGGSPTGGLDGQTFWNPNSTVTQLP